MASVRCLGQASPVLTTVQESVPKFLRRTKYEYQLRNFDFDLNGSVPERRKFNTSSVIEYHNNNSGGKISLLALARRPLAPHTLAGIPR
ncbi:hypothetical protein CCMA1212_004129 [Trichoderma ghanense]|uniref:Uncharacterized protein n=1 Tax=Trichoderma ghanense TaxID=65468 RepID=A0ABY2H8L5_9HYPO